MIQINCTSCQELLQIDEGFAGGVCRCKFCGAIQTVPKHLKSGNGEGQYEETSVSSGGGAKTLFQKKSTAESGTGLDDLAGAVTSSGLTSSRLKRTADTTTKATPPNKKMGLIVGVAGGIIAILLGVIIYMAVRDRSTKTDPDPITGPGAKVTVTNPDGTQTTITKPKGAAFLGQPIAENSVVYVLDHGQATSSEKRLDLLKAALINSVKSLGPAKQFAVLWWQGDNTDVWPKAGLQPATSENVEKLRAEIDDVFAAGNTKPPNGLDKAFKNAAAVVIVPVKGFPDESIPAAILKARAGSNAKVYAFTLEQPDLAPMLKKLAADTKGFYKDVPLGELRAAGE